MKALKKILVSVLIILVLLLVVSFFLPSHYSVQRSVTINAPMEQVVAQVNKFENWGHWSPWAEKDSTIVNTFEGAAGTDTYKMSWTSANSGIGSMTRSETKIEGASASITNKLAFTEPMESESTNTFLFEKTEEGVKVTWTDEGDLGNNPISKYFGLFLDGMMGPDFEKGLANLKAYAENPENQKPAEPEKMMVNGFDAQLVNIEGFTVIGIRNKMPASELDSSDFAENYGKMGAYCEANGITPVGPPAAIYYNYNPEGDVDMMFAFPVVGDTKSPGATNEIKLVNVPACQVLEITYIGPYDQVGETWEAVDGWLAENGLQYAGAPWESYVSDPGNTPADELITKIVIPVSQKAEVDVSEDTGH